MDADARRVVWRADELDACGFEAVGYDLQRGSV